MSPWLEVFGRLHPFVLHLPIGLLAGLAGVEGIALLRRKAASRELTLVLAWLAGVAGGIAAGTGYVLRNEGGYDEATLTWHLRLGIAVGIAGLITAVLRSLRATPRAYRAALLVTLALLVPAGHFGAVLTHGAGFITEPLARRKEPARLDLVDPPDGERAATGIRGADPSGTQAADAPGSQPEARPTYAGGIAAIFASRCASCHGETKHKGGLSLHTPASIMKGSEDGAVIIAGQPDDSELVRRIRLPQDDHDHMPPEGKPQLTPEQIGLIEAWIAAGASFTAEAESPDDSSNAIRAPGQRAPAPDDSHRDEQAESSSSPEPPPPQASAIQALRSALVNVEAVRVGSNRLVVNFAAIAPDLTDSRAEALLAPVTQQVTGLSLARSSVTDDIAELLATMPHLRRLDLRGTALTDAGLGLLGGHAGLEELVLAQTRLTDAAVETLRRLPNLRRVHLWRSGMSQSAVAALGTLRPEMEIITGEEPLAAALEIEPEIKLENTAPIPGAAPDGVDRTELAPVNAKCPVSGKDVDPRYLVVHKGRVIGFCCPNCPKEFWADPARFEAELR